MEHLQLVVAPAVASNNFSGVVDGMLCFDLIKVNKPIQSGDSGGGAIGGIIDGGRTNEIIGINKGTSSTETVLVKGSYILNAYN